MNRKPWHLHRRTFLRGVGATLALPFLECMGASAKSLPRPKRFCTIYFPYGVSMQDKGEDAEWSWFPKGEGRDYKLNNSLQCFEPLREQLSILGGLSHPNGRKIGGHDSADIFLTAAELKGGQLKNSMSLDQLLAEKLGEDTRFRSLSLSVDGGVGEATRSSTLSFSRTGQPVPAMHQPRLVYNRLFGVEADPLAQQRQKLQNSGSMLDLVLEHSKSVRRQLGKQDQEKLDEYLQSVRQIEERVERSEKWLDVPKPQVNSDQLHLDANDETPGELIKTMLDLMYLAYQTDSTRFITYQMGNMNGATSIATKFPQLLGFGKNQHTLAHEWNKKGGAEALGKWDRFRAEQVAYFLERLKSSPEGDGNLLDHTVVLYGSSNSNTHNNRNYPLVLAGGEKLGFKHGQFHKFREEVPLSNLFVTMMNRLGMPAPSFVDSTGELTEVVG
ncbi:MAG: DUF1552 domain-containing protein [Verrucomicrobia bacterium]|nr:DUF1552 domain-containing protein [Verrucomicrobiota bacterium]